MATNSSAGNGAIQSPSLGPTANPTFESQGQQPPLTKPNAPVSEEAKAQILGNSTTGTSTADQSTGGKDAKDGGKGAAEHEAGSSKEEEGAAKQEGWSEEVKDFERRMAGGGH
ncbi:hypothetical protein B0T20DRAFT_225060 [Sordaria brevicollis]|uniref:Uncharacterized protein n=1 Tax=Sordaria brevicollis TaxID=83679 RepID=A0AAE0PCW8_SORBR|nr:hypothetical protein B0T20DRAFT_225060 [Sordaria brevicollis]